jgi:hypothetical protein
MGSSKQALRWLATGMRKRGRPRSRWMKGYGKERTGKAERRMRVEHLKIYQ